MSFLDDVTCRKGLQFMQQVQQRELPERISWARAVIYAVGFFFLSAILVGQLPSYVYTEMTSASLEGFEHGIFSLAVTCLAGFFVIFTYMLLFDPKPVVPPRLVATIGGGVAIVGFLVTLLVTTTGCEHAASYAAVACNQYFPKEDTSILPLLGGKFLWFQASAIDLVAVGLAILGLGCAMILFGVLALRERGNSDRRDLGTTPGIRRMTVGSILLLVVFMIFYSYSYNEGAWQGFFPGHPYWGYKLLQAVVSVILGAAVLLALGAFVLRLHYWMRPIRKRVMPGLYMIGALGLAQTGAILVVIWALSYPFIAWTHGWSFIGLGEFITKCARTSAVPQSCSFGSQFGYLVDAIVTMNGFALLLLAAWAWKTHRHLVLVGSTVVTAVIAATALLVHTEMAMLPTAAMFCVAILVLGTIWTAVSRREFALVGQNNLGCLGQWLIAGTCLCIYLGAFAFFSMGQFGEETPPNIPFTPGAGGGAFVMLILLGVLGGLQFFFLARNRYKA
jgi:hypothetical protein